MIWRARRSWSPECLPREQTYFFQSQAGLALAFPIVGNNIVWTFSAPVAVRPRRGASAPSPHPCWSGGAGQTGCPVPSLLAVCNGAWL